jgi:hypothetical protein
MSISAITQAVYAKLTADTSSTSVYGLTSGRIYNLTGEQESALPMVTFHLTSSKADATFAKNSSEHRLEVDVWDDSAGGTTNAMAINDAAFVVLNRATATATGYSKLFFECIDPGVVEPVGDNTINVRSEYRILARE